jgi:hypothetical protein
MEADRLDQLARKHAVPRRDIEEQLRNAVQQPAYWAPVRRALVGRDGSLWILPSWETERWSVFLDGPTPSFFVDAPDSAVVMHVSTREMWAVFSDSLGRPSIVKYEIANR